MTGRERGEISEESSSVVSPGYIHHVSSGVGVVGVNRIRIRISGKKKE